MHWSWKRDEWPRACRGACPWFTFSGFNPAPVTSVYRQTSYKDLTTISRDKLAERRDSINRSPFFESKSSRRSGQPASVKPSSSVGHTPKKKRWLLEISKRCATSAGRERSSSTTERSEGDGPRGARPQRGCQPSQSMLGSHTTRLPLVGLLMGCWPGTYLPRSLQSLSCFFTARLSAPSIPDGPKVAINGSRSFGWQ